MNLLAIYGKIRARDETSLVESRETRRDEMRFLKTSTRRDETRFDFQKLPRDETRRDSILANSPSSGVHTIFTDAVSYEWDHVHLAVQGQMK